MRPKVVEIQFETTLERPVRLVLNGAADSWPATRSLVLELLEQMPGRVETISFLGSDRTWRISLPGDFDRQARDLARQNSNRPALLNPVAEPWHRQPNPESLVVISNREPIDLADWTDRPDGEVAGLILVNTGPEPWPGGQEAIHGSGLVAAVERHLSNPVVSARVRGAGFFPLQVETMVGKTGLEYVRPDIRLSIEDLPATARLSVRVKALAVSMPELELERADGGSEAVAGSQTGAWFRQPVWTPLEETTAPVVEAGIRQASFTCPFCGDTHGPGEFFCTRGKLLLGGLPFNSTVLFRDGSFLALDEKMPGHVLGRGDRVIGRDGRIYDWDGYNWVFAREIEPYEEVADGIHALFTDF